MNDLTRKWFKAKDIKNILGVTSGQLFHWQRWNLIRPEIKGKGRAYKDLYNFNNLIDIALVKELVKLGIDPSRMDILRYLWEDDCKISELAKEGQASKNTFFILFFLSEGKINAMRTGQEEAVIKALRRNLGKKNRPPVIISINITEIVRRLEKKMGVKF